MTATNQALDRGMRTSKASPYAALVQPAAAEPSQEQVVTGDFSRIAEVKKVGDNYTFVPVAKETDAQGNKVVAADEMPRKFVTLVQKNTPGADESIPLFALVHQSNARGLGVQWGQFSQDGKTYIVAMNLDGQPYTRTDGSEYRFEITTESATIRTNKGATFEVKLANNTAGTATLVEEMYQDLAQRGQLVNPATKTREQFDPKTLFFVTDANQLANSQQAGGTRTGQFVGRFGAGGSQSASGQSGGAASMQDPRFRFEYKSFNKESFSRAWEVYKKSLSVNGIEGNPADLTSDDIINNLKQKLSPSEFAKATREIAFAMLHSANQALNGLNDYKNNTDSQRPSSGQAKKMLIESSRLLRVSLETRLPDESKQQQTYAAIAWASRLSPDQLVTVLTNPIKGSEHFVEIVKTYMNLKNAERIVGEQGKRTDDPTLKSEAKEIERYIQSTYPVENGLDNTLRDLARRGIKQDAR